MAGIFGNIMSGETAGMPNPLWQQLGIPQFTQVPSIAPQQGGIFGAQPDTPKQKPNWLGILSDGLLAFSGKDPIYMQSMQAQRNAALKAQQEAAQAAAQDAQWYQHKDYELSHSAPSEDSFTRALHLAGIDPNSQEARDMARKRADMLTNPVQLMPDGMGGYTPFRPSQSPPQSPRTISAAEFDAAPGVPPAAPSPYGKPSGSPLGVSPPLQIISKAQAMQQRHQMGDAAFSAWLQQNGYVIGQ